MSNQKIRTARLNKQQRSLNAQPIQFALVKRDGNLNFYFCLYNLDNDFKNGFYFGLLELHENYPFAAPKLYFYTPNGRYDTNMPICTSFTNYHQQSWTSAWNVRSLIQGTVSFMYSHQASYGCRSDPAELRKKLAQQSLSWNMQNQTFLRLFGSLIKQKLHSFVKLGIKIFDKELLEILKKQLPQQLQGSKGKEFGTQNQLTQNKKKSTQGQTRKRKFSQTQEANNKFERYDLREQGLQQRMIQNDVDQGVQFKLNRQQKQQNEKQRKQILKKQRIKKIAKIVVISLSLSVGIPLACYIIKKALG